MAEAFLLIGDRKEALSDDVTTFGRATDNAFPFSDDSNISRYHAEIEKRGDDFVLIDLGSSNGTTVNGASVSSEKILNNGDTVTLGGSVTFKFETESKEEETEAAKPEEKASAAATAAPSAPAAKSSKGLYLTVGAIALLAIIAASAAGAFYYFKSQPQCTAKIEITEPESGEAINKSVNANADLTDGECVARVVFMLDDQELSASAAAPFSAVIDPKQLADFADGFNHTLSAIAEDENGKQIASSVISIALDTRAMATPTPEVQPTQVAAANNSAGQTKPAQNAGKTASPAEVMEMSKRVVGQFQGKYAYKFDSGMLLELQKKTAEYAAPGYFARAQQYRDSINVAFVQEQNLDPALGYILAMARSKFNPAKNGANEGLWQLSNDFVTANAYNGLCGGENLSAPTQMCAARSAAAYSKALIYGVFEGDVVYGVAAFGKSPAEAAAWKAQLPANRLDIWRNLKTVQERDAVLRFFAASIVAENPQKFGLKNDQPLSELYKFLM